MSTEKKYESRSLIISDFRNLGVSALRKKGEERTSLKINRSLNKDEIGGLVIILGSNNCGKSNVLDAITKCPKQDFDESRDWTDFVQYPRSPQLTMEVAGGRFVNMVQPKIVPGLGNCKVSGSSLEVLLYILRQSESYDEYCNWLGHDESGKTIDPETYLNEVEYNVRRLDVKDKPENAEGYSFILRNRKGLKGDGIDLLAKTIDEGDFSVIAENEIEVMVRGTPIRDMIPDCMESIEIKGKQFDIPVFISKQNLKERLKEEEKGIKGLAKKATKLFKQEKKNIDVNSKLVITDISGGVKETEIVPDDFSSEYGYNLGNNVYVYRQKTPNNSDLKTNPSKPNDFITKVFAILGYDKDTIINGKY